MAYPVLTLPPEITAEIFLRCRPLDPFLFDQPYVYTYDHNMGYAVGYRPSSRASIGTPPLSVLSQVCRAWRDIAIGTPALWAALRIDPQGRLHGAVKADTWLARARDSPLTLSIYTRNYRITPFLDTFQQHAAKMRAVDLEISTYDLEEMVEVLGSWSFPALQALSLWLYNCDYEDLHGPPIQLLAPLLRDVWMCQWMPGVVVLGIPWDQLTELTAQHYNINNCLSILQLTPNLVRCRLSLFPHTGHPITWQGPTEPSTIPVVLPNLRALTIFKSIGNEAEQAGSADILDFLILPALQTLEIFDAAQNPHFLDVFLARSAPPLHTLAVHHYNVEQYGRDDVQYGTAIDVGAFALLPGLARLELWRPTPAFAAALFADVFARGGARALLPRLQTLALWGCSRLAQADNNTEEWWEEARERNQWADQFGGDNNIEEAFMKLKGLTAAGLEVVMENKRQV
ncbi:hypothetical protein FB451DRAFT_1499638 [Mycena latifolia]|nr:hypothetical protein FB451DRAFT_1499638 [Mycena latifolia]